MTTPTSSTSVAPARNRATTIRSIILGVVIALAFIALIIVQAMHGADLIFWVTIAVPSVVALVLWILERRDMDPATIGIIVALIAIACALRALRFPIQGVQFSSWLIILAGLALGPEAGFLTGALIPLVSGFFLGLGTWVPWQMLAWGLIGAIAGWLSNLHIARNRWAMAGFGLVSGWIFGIIMNLQSYFFAAGTQYAEGLLVTFAAGFVGDTISGVSTAVLLALTIPWATDLIARTRTRHTIRA